MNKTLKIILIVVGVVALVFGSIVVGGIIGTIETANEADEKFSSFFTNSPIATCIWNVQNSVDFDKVFFNETEKEQQYNYIEKRCIELRYYENLKLKQDECQNNSGYWTATGDIFPSYYCVVGKNVSELVIN